MQDRPGAEDPTGDAAPEAEHAEAERLDVPYEQIPLQGAPQDETGRSREARVRRFTRGLLFALALGLLVALGIAVHPLVGVGGFVVLALVVVVRSRRRGS